MKKLLAIIPLFLLVFSLIPMTTADTETIPFLMIGINNPQNGDTVKKTVEIKATAISSSPLEDLRWLSPIRFTVMGDGHGLIVMQPDCEINEDKTRAVCTFEWNTKDFKGETVKIRAFADNEDGKHVDMEIEVKVKGYKKKLAKFLNF